MKIIISALFFVFLWAGCDNSVTNNSGRLKIVASTTIIKDVVQNISGNHAEISCIVPANTSPHGFVPTPMEMKMAANADIIFINGLGLETFIETVIKNSGTKASVVSLSDSIKIAPHSDPNSHEHDNHTDPHVWLDPSNVKEWTRIISAALAETDPSRKELYLQNAGHYAVQLDSLDSEISLKLSAVLPANRKLVTDHMVFGYFGRKYKFTQIGAVIPGFSSLSEPSARELADLQDLVIENKVKAIFVDTNLNPSLAARLAADCNAELVRLYTGALDVPGSQADTYLKYMHFNAETIAKALQ